MIGERPAEIASDFRTLVAIDREYVAARPAEKPAIAWRQTWGDAIRLIESE
jgi:hypothetical protein